jgi:hypothetical protein
VQQVLGTNLEGEEVVEATEAVAVQVAVVVAVDTRAGGVVAIEVPNHRATRIDRRAIQTELKSQDQCATSARKRGIGSRTVSDI